MVFVPAGGGMYMRGFVTKIIRSELKQSLDVLL